MVNYKLYHYQLCPFSRKVRIFLSEKNVQADLAVENFWEKRRGFYSLNPAGQIPVLLNYENNKPICGSDIICEYLEEKHGGLRFFGDSPEARAEIKRVSNWFNEKFFQEVTSYIINEKIVKYHMAQGAPRAEYLRSAKINLDYHISYISYLLKEQKWLAGNRISLADISAAAQISVLDFLGHFPWKKAESVKEWYSLIKSRPSFKPLLNDTVSGFRAATNYSNLDF